MPIRNGPQLVRWSISTWTSLRASRRLESVSYLAVIKGAKRRAHRQAIGAGEKALAG
jgi:hypothetical protein